MLFESYQIMFSDKLILDPYLFEQHFQAFTEFVQKNSGISFASFASNPYTEEQEGYKADIYRTARIKLGFQRWKEKDVGEGKIAQATINAIELMTPKNNLVLWQSRFGDDARPHQALVASLNDDAKLRQIERELFRLFRLNDDKFTFENLLSFFGRKYSLLAYLFFLKDRSKYVPIAPTFFDTAFKRVGIEFITSHQCSWANYTIYLALIAQVRDSLSKRISAETTLLDAHSFLWMLVDQMERAKVLPNVDNYLRMTITERETLVRTRIGQDKFRDALLQYWEICSITGLSDRRLLRASHIKPWKLCDSDERLDLYNGLLLSPTLDACFDAGYISFNKQGEILISDRLSVADAITLGISKELNLRKVEPEHRKYLEFHREHIFN